MLNTKKLNFIVITYIGTAYICLYFLNREILGEYTMWLYAQLFNNIGLIYKNIIALIIIFSGMILLAYCAGEHTKIRCVGPVLLIIFALILRLPVDIAALAANPLEPIWIIPLLRFCCNIIYSVLLLMIALALTKGFYFKNLKCNNKYVIIACVLIILTVIIYFVFVWRIYRIDQFAVHYVNQAIASEELIIGYMPQDFYEIYCGLLGKRLLIGCYVASCIGSTCSAVLYFKLSRP